MAIRRLIIEVFLIIALVVLPSCRPAAAPVLPPATAAAPALPAATTAAATGDPAADQAATLGSLQQVDDYPLYTMHYVGGYERRVSPASSTSMTVPGVPGLAWGCSLFAALGDPQDRLYGRNFDWDYSPALLLFTAPPGDYASVSMVDMTYLGVSGKVDTPAERQGLLGAPFLPFDGMNERGLVVGMAAVEPGDVPADPAQKTVDSLGIIRLMLDRAATVDEAVALLESYNIDFTGGPPIHYLIADRTGRAALVEFYKGKRVVQPNTQPWHLATNFIRASVDSPRGQCPRYDAIEARLVKTQGRLSASGGLGLLEQVAQKTTQWSAIYSLTRGEVTVAMGRQYGRTHTFPLGK